jgi:hypothetical protein
MITYAKLHSGSWGVRSTEPVVAGQVVTVRKRNGEVKQETVANVVWTNGEVTLAAIVEAPRPRRNGCDCGEGCCSPRCRCEAHCVCRGGNIHDC